MAVQKPGAKPPAQTNQVKKPTTPKTTQAPNSKGPQLDPAIIAQLAQLQQAKNTPTPQVAPPQPPAPQQGNSDMVPVSRQQLQQLQQELIAAKQQGPSAPQRGMMPPNGGQGGSPPGGLS